MTDEFQTFQGLPLFFPKTIQGFIQFSEIQWLFQAGLEIKAGAGTMAIVCIADVLSCSHWGLDPLPPLRMPLWEVVAPSHHGVRPGYYHRENSDILHKKSCNSCIFAQH